MSYDIYLTDAVSGETLELDAPHHMRGGTYVMGGTREAHLNVTYNYGAHFRRVFPARPWREGDSNHDKEGVKGIRTIYGMTGAESLPVLTAAIAQLGNDVHPDYWEPTDGNAKRALIQLHALASLRPDGIWKGD